MRTRLRYVVVWLFSDENHTSLLALLATFLAGKSARSLREYKQEFDERRRANKGRLDPIREKMYKAYNGLGAVGVEPTIIVCEPKSSCDVSGVLEMFSAGNKKILIIDRVLVILLLLYYTVLL